MTHVKISREGMGPYELTVDGIDMSMSVLAGPTITIPVDCEKPPTVTVTIPADVLELDFPDAVLVALRENDERERQA